MTSPTSSTHRSAQPAARGRVLIVGRGPGVLTEAVDRLRAAGYAADATNQFDDLLDDYDVTGIDVLVFGGMVPTRTKQHLTEEVGRLSPQTAILQGLVGVAAVITAQVQAHFSTGVPDGAPRYDARTRSISLSLAEPAAVTVVARWAIFRPPALSNDSSVLVDGRLGAGEHVLALPEEVPQEASYLTVDVGGAVRVLTVAGVPERITALVPTTASESVLPPVAVVRTGARERGRRRS